MIQLLLPGIPEVKHFKKKCSCDHPGSLLAIYFRMGQLEEEDGCPGLLGYDCPFDDSDTLYACNEDHLEELITKATEELEGVSFPEIIVNPKGEIQKAVYLSLARKLGKDYDERVFTDFLYSQGRESLESLWYREKWRWIEDV